MRSHGTPDAAIAACTKLIKAAGKDAAARAQGLNNRGNAFYLSGDYRQAIEDYSAALKLKPEPARYNNRANAYRASWQYGLRPFKIARGALGARSNVIPAALQGRAATSGIKMGKYDLALDDYGRALEAPPDRASLYALRGSVYYLQQRNDLAMADFDRAVTLDPNNATALVNRGELNRALAHNDQAVADFDAAIKVAPENGAALAGRGEVLHGSGSAATAPSTISPMRSH